nr:hypothetical protein GCM10020093_067200 [Planobispora longispora]
MARKTLNGLEADVADGTRRVPFLVSGLVGGLGGVAMLAVPAAYAVERVLHRDGLRVAEGLFAAIAGMVLSFALGEWILGPGPEDLRLLLTGGRSGVEPLNALLTSVIAYVTAMRISRRPTWRAALWTAVAINSVALFAGLAATIPGIAVSIIVGLAVGYATLYGLGSPNTRPPGSTIVAAVRKLGFHPVKAHRMEDDPQDSRRYAIGLKDGTRLDVTVLDRDRQVAGLLYRLWRRIRLNSETRRKAIRSLRAELEREALMAYASQAAGVGSPGWSARARSAPRPRSSSTSTSPPGRSPTSRMRRSATTCSPRSGSRSCSCRSSGWPTAG